MSVWRTAGGLVETLTGHEGWVFGAGFTADGSRVISTGLDRMTRLWGPNGASVAIPVSLIGAHVSRDGTWLAGLDRETERGVVWDTRAGSRVLELDGERFTLSRDGVVAWVATEHTVAVHDLARGTRRTLDDMPEGITQLALSVDGALLVAGTRAGVVHVVDLRRPSARWVYRATDAIAGLALADDASWIAAWGTDVHVIDTRTRLGRALPGAAGRAMIAADGTRVITRDAKKRVLQGPPAAAPDARERARGPARGGVARRGAPGVRRRPRHAAHPRPSGGADAELGGPHGPGRRGGVVAGGHAPRVVDGAKSVRLWHVASRRGVALAGRAMELLAWSPDGVWLAALGDDDRIRLWDVRTGALHELAGHRGWVGWLGFSPDATRLASGGGDGIVRVWTSRRAPRRSSAGTTGFVRAGHGRPPATGSRRAATAPCACGPGPPRRRRCCTVTPAGSPPSRSIHRARRSRAAASIAPCACGTSRAAPVARSARTTTPCSTSRCRPTARRSRRRASTGRVCGPPSAARTASCAATAGR
ncbi:MAG: hypothetical protein KIT31_04190 [Deltaproteobacteria bacterium]|nr:hypothetical protein [Deltaproteobacteria bacterium]